jgi:hypothetical protein
LEKLLSSPPVTDREYAYFHAIGNDDPEQISALLELVPAKIWSLGETFARGGREFRRRSSKWQLDSGLTDGDPLNAHIEALLICLEPRKTELSRIRKSFRTQFVCVGYYFQSFSWELDFELQKRATDLGVSFWFDIYSHGDPHEEIVDLREQMGARTS